MNALEFLALFFLVEVWIIGWNLTAGVVLGHPPETKHEWYVYIGLALCWPAPLGVSVKKWMEK